MDLETSPQLLFEFLRASLLQYINTFQAEQIVITIQYDSPLLFWKDHTLQAILGTFLSHTNTYPKAEII